MSKPLGTKIESILIAALHPNHMGIFENGLISANRYFSAKGLSFQRLVIFAGCDWENEKGIKNAKLRSMQNDRIEPGEEGKKLDVLDKAKVEVIYGDFENADALMKSVEEKLQYFSGNRLFLHLDCGSSIQGIALSLNGLRHGATCLYRMSPPKKSVSNDYETGDLREVNPDHLSKLWRHETKGRLNRDFIKWKTNGKLTSNLGSYIKEIDDTTRKRLSYNERCETLRDDFGRSYNNFILAEKSVMKHLTRIFIDTYSPEIQFKPKIFSRPKEFRSFWKKLQDKEMDEGIQEQPFERITDCVGAKVVFYRLGDYKAGVKQLEKSELFVSRNGGLVNGENKKKRFEYEATHFDVKLSPKALGALEISLSEIPIEIQLKTIIGDAMNLVHHELVYKDFDRSKPLTKEEKGTMVARFKFVGSLLGGADIEIDSICNKYNPRKGRRARKK